MHQNQNNNKNASNQNVKCMCEDKAQKLRRRCAPRIIAEIAEKSALSSDKLHLLIKALPLEYLKVRTQLLVVTGKSVQPIKNQLLAVRDPLNISDQLLHDVGGRRRNWSWRWHRGRWRLGNCRGLRSRRRLGRGGNVSIHRTLLRV